MSDRQNNSGGDFREEVAGDQFMQRININLRNEIDSELSDVEGEEENMTSHWLFH